MPWYRKNPRAAKGAEARTQIQETVSVPARPLRRSHSPAAVRHARREKTNCRRESPKNTDS